VLTPLDRHQSQIDAYRHPPTRVPRPWLGALEGS